MFYIIIAGEYMLKMDLEYESEILFIKLTGNLNKRNTHKINNYIIPVLKKHKIKNVVLNLDNINGIDESGINSIINVKSIIKCNKGNLYLCDNDNYLIRFLKSLNIKSISSDKSLIINKKV